MGLGMCLHGNVYPKSIPSFQSWHPVNAMTELLKCFNGRASQKTMFHIGVIWSSHGPIVIWSWIIPDPVKTHVLLRRNGGHLVKS